MAARTPSLATFAILSWAILFPMVFASPAGAQNLEAGKSPAQIFASTCTACHRGSRGLLKTVSPGSLSGFLREHYTTSDTMASALSAYLIAGGDGRPAGAPRQTASSTDGNTPEQAPDGRKQRQAALTPDGQPEGTAKDARKPRPPAEVPAAATTEGQPPPADQLPKELPKGPKARAKAAALAKAAAAKAAADAAKGQPAKTEVAALPLASQPPAPKPPLADIGAKPAEDPADALVRARQKDDEARRQVAKTDPVEQPKSDAAKVASAPASPMPKPQEQTMPGTASPESDRASLETSKPAPAASNGSTKPADTAEIESAKASVSLASKASEGVSLPQPAANSMAPPPSPPISY